MPTHLLVATGNAHKLAEYAQLLNMPMLTLCSLRDVAISADAPEDGTTFVANALQKARYYAAKSGLPTLADDSGIVVDALAGAPGVYSARYGTPDLDDAGRRRLLLANVNALGDVVRSARFVCVIALVLPDGREFHTQGICEGQIAMHEAGDEGFGYDPIFWLPERQCTIAQLSAAQKHAISHRGQATRAMHAILQGLEP
ncbi:MAG: RdgB/HAM1 family non-canonical purine NTP pyrophosphatase [Roseiflexaceae bacterium]|nr:RdgB/HAM1 family non-canonical purine NTP pyrophosphatase [Chloroflexaceae bacterium]